ncbi:MAG: hypothetical protein MN733_41685, partial [Nitrososphaera sp.]|nr:hypothetical protein [Nitrososphaera sp.]
DDNPLGAYVCSPQEVIYLKRHYENRYQAIVPGVRDGWMAKDHQERIAGVYETLKAGANWLVMGVQLSKGNPGKEISAEKSQQRTLAEVERYFAEHSE